MSSVAKKPATTPIPVQLSATEFNAFIFPHLSMPKRGPKCKLGYQCVFNLILCVLYTGMQWRCLPVPKDINGNPAIHSQGLGKNNHPHDSGGRSYDPRGAGRVPKSIARTLFRPRTRTSSCMVQ